MTALLLSFIKIAGTLCINSFSRQLNQ